MDVSGAILTSYSLDSNIIENYALAATVDPPLICPMMNRNAASPRRILSQSTEKQSVWRGVALFNQSPILLGLTATSEAAMRRKSVRHSTDVVEPLKRKPPGE